MYFVWEPATILCHESVRPKITICACTFHGISGLKISYCMPTPPPLCTNHLKFGVTIQGKLFAGEKWQLWFSKLFQNARIFGHKLTALVSSPDYHFGCDVKMFDFLFLSTVCSIFIHTYTLYYSICVCIKGISTQTASAFNMQTNRFEC